MRASHRIANPWVAAAAVVVAGWGCRGILGAEYGELVAAGKDGGVGGAAGAGGAADDAADESDAPEPKPPLSCVIEGATTTLLDLSKGVGGGPDRWTPRIKLVTTNTDKVLVGLSREGMGTIAYDVARIEPTGEVQWAHMPGVTGSLVGLGRLDGQSTGVFIFEPGAPPAIKMARLPDDMGSIDGLPGTVSFDPTIGLDGLDAKSVRDLLASPAQVGFTVAFNVESQSSTFTAHVANKRGAGVAVPTDVFEGTSEGVDVRTAIFVDNLGVALVGNEKTPLRAISYDPSDPPNMLSDTSITSGPGLALLDAKPTGDGNISAAFGDRFSDPPALYVGVLTKDQFLESDPRTLLVKNATPTPPGFEYGELHWCGKSVLGAGKIRPDAKQLALTWTDRDGQNRFFDVLQGASVNGKIVVAGVGCGEAPGISGGTVTVLWIEEMSDKVTPYHMLKRIKVNCS